MTSSKTSKGTNSKVRNTKAQSQFKTGKNTVSESLIRESFKPRFSTKDGTARLTFCGIEHSDDKNKKPYLKVAFSCFDTTHEAPQIIGVLANYNVAEGNKMGKILTKMGFQISQQIEVVNEDDEYGTKETVTNLGDIFDFFRSKTGLVYKAQLTPTIKFNPKTKDYEEQKGLWDIVIDTLTPLLLADGTQDSDMKPSDISDEEFLSPDIAMSDSVG